MGKVNSELKINGLNEKYLLKQIFKDRLPQRIVNRWKNPYRAPISKAILNSNLNLVKEYCSEESLRNSGLFDAVKVFRLISKLEKSSSASEVDDMALVGIISTQIIYNKFVENFQFDYNETDSFDLFFDQRSFNKN
jgi:asparagine synthase (glutamine-hydrolysing)